MPVVIRELIVKVNVEEGRTDAPQRPAAVEADDREALISECVEKVIEIMKREEQR